MQHYEFYYFIVNKVADPAHPERLLFDYSASILKEQIAEVDVMSKQTKESNAEGYKDDPIVTKVVDRRWYEKNKHIYPASMWKEFKPGKEFEDLAKGRKDAQGNSFFYS